MIPQSLIFLCSEASCLHTQSKTGPFIYTVLLHVKRMIHAVIKSILFEFFICFPQAGVGKLNEAKELVDNLKKKAGEQSKILADKQAEADESLSEITETMKVSQCRQIGNTLFHC